MHYLCQFYAYFGGKKTGSPPPSMVIPVRDITSLWSPSVVKSACGLPVYR